MKQETTAPETISFAEGFEILRKELASGSKPIPENPPALPLGSIKTATSLLQPRTFSGGEQSQSTDHTDRLVEAIHEEESKLLDPLVVWWSGKMWRVIDGHHRLGAYHRVQKAGRIKLGLIPVTVFEGTLEEALIEATRLNSKDKLPMTRADKLNRAWQFTVLGSFSKKAIAQACKVSNGTVGNMRSKLEEMKIRFEQWENMAKTYSWEEVQRLLSGDQDTKTDEWVERMAEEWAKRLGKAFGSKFAERGQIAARALEIYSRSLVKDLIEQWGYLDSEVDDEELPF